MTSPTVVKRAQPTQLQGRTSTTEVQQNEETYAPPNYNEGVNVQGVTYWGGNRKNWSLLIRTETDSLGCDIPPSKDDAPL